MHFQSQIFSLTIFEHFVLYHIYSYYICFLVQFRVYCLRGRKKRMKTRMCSHLLIYYPNAHNGQGYYRPKLAPRNSGQVALVGCRNPVTEPSLLPSRAYNNRKLYQVWYPGNSDVEFRYFNCWAKYPSLLTVFIIYVIVVDLQTLDAT